jgi:hypothetical protein
VAFLLPSSFHTSVHPHTGKSHPRRARCRTLGLAVYACRDIGRHREILVHYGSTFPRLRHGYSAGTPCVPPTHMLQPANALGPVPLAALAFVEGSASDVMDSSDESYEA